MLFDKEPFFVIAWLEKQVNKAPQIMPFSRYYFVPTTSNLNHVVSFAYQSWFRHIPFQYPD